MFKQKTALISLLFLLIGCSQRQSLEWIPFTWESDTISGEYIEKAYLYIPVKIDDLPHDFTMQLDLGTTTTVFDGNVLGTYLEQYPSLSKKCNAPWCKDINLQMGSVVFSGIDIGYMKKAGEVFPNDSVYTDTPKDIGVIGPDIFQNKILVIDYKSNRLAVSDSLPTEYKDLPAEKFELKMVLCYFHSASMVKNAS